MVSNQKPAYSILWLRNLLLACVVLFVSFKYLTYAAFERGFTTYGTGAALTQICLVWLMVFAVAVVMTRRLPALLRIARKDLAFLFIFLFIAGPLMLGTVYFTRMTTYVYYHGDSQAETKLLLEQDLPRLAPSDDALNSLHNGSPSGDIPWRDWLQSDGGMPPALAWGGFTILFLSICFSLVFLFSKRWLEEEQLAFPLARLGELFVRGYRNPMTGDRLPLIGTKAFWIGFVITFLFQICTYLSPGLEGRLGAFSISDTVPLVGGLDYQSRVFWWRPVFMAMLFLCPRQILGSALVFHLIIVVFTILGHQLGYKGYTGSELPGASVFPFKRDQLVGAAISMSVIMLWLSRRYLWEQILAIKSLLQGKHRARNPLAMLVLLVSLVGFIVWCVLIGFSLRVTLIFLGCLLLSAIINTRGRAETGMPMIFVFSGFSPFEFVSILGTRLVGIKTIAATALHGWVFWNNIGQITPSLMDSMKLGQILKQTFRWVCGIAIAAVAAGVILGVVVTFDSMYGMGLNKWNFGYGDGGFQTRVARSLMQKDVGINGLHAAYALLGGTVVTAAWACRAFFPGFVLHPMGYMLSLHPILHELSLGLIIAYTVKRLGMHYGGVKTYTLLVPLFIGLLAGQIVGGALGGVLNSVFETNVYIPLY